MPSRAASTITPRRIPIAIGAEYRVVLPVSGVDVVGHSLRAVHYMYMGSMERMRREVNAAIPQPATGAHRCCPKIPEITPGSNTWAIGPSRSASGKSMLIINPHLAWGDTFYRYMEVHLVGPGYDLYGAPQIGFPTPVVGFNRRTGWGRTVNTIDTVDFYRLTVKGDQYEFDGKLRPFEHASKTLKIKQPDGSFHRRESSRSCAAFRALSSYNEKGMMVAMRVAGLDRPKMLEQWFRMGEAKNLEEFKSALRMMAVPMWNANYADADGHIMMVFDGLVPRRSTGDVKYWAGVVPGDTSETLWTDYLSFDELPKSLDPASGFNQNTNEPPWFMTMPMLDPSKYPAYLSPPDIGASLYPREAVLSLDHGGTRRSATSNCWRINFRRASNWPTRLPDLVESGRRFRSGARSREVGSFDGDDQPRRGAVQNVRGPYRDGRRSAREIRSAASAGFGIWPRRSAGRR